MSIDNQHACPSCSVRTVAALSLILVQAGSAWGAAWTGAGDGMNWSDPGNWSPSSSVPYTGGAAQNSVVIRAHSASGTGDVGVHLDAATAGTFFQDGTYNNSGNFFNPETDSERNLTVDMDWGGSYTNNGMWIGGGSAGPGSVTVNQTGGTLTLVGATYLGRNTAPGAAVTYDLQGGTLVAREPAVAGRSDSLGEITLRISGGTFDNLNSSLPNRRFHLGGRNGSTATLEISGTGSFLVNDYRGDNGGGEASAGTGGSTYFRIVGSDATISFSHAFNTDQDGKSNLVNEIQFIADAGGVSTITAANSSATFYPSETTTLRVDLTAYAGVDELTLFQYDRSGGAPFGQVIIIDPLHRGYVFGEGGGRSYLYLAGGPPAPEATSFFTK